MASDAPRGQARKATEEDKLQLLQKYDAWVFDLDGTLWKGNTLIDGVVQVLSLLKRLGKTIIYVTNNSTKSRSSYAKKLEALGLPVQVLYSTWFACQFWRCQITR